MAEENGRVRDEELRMFALQTATKDRFSFDKASPDEVRERVMADVRAYYEFLTEGSNKEITSNA